jgi:GGDEF domain-containing protein
MSPGPGGSNTLSAVSPLWRYRWLRVLLVAAPGLAAAVGVLTAMEGSLAFVVALNAAAGVIISSAMFLAVSLAARRVTEERLELTRATEQEVWRARAIRFSIHHDNSGLYADWYFRLRLQEELERSKRYGVRFAVMLVKPIGLHADAEFASAAGWFAEHLQRHLRKSDVPALLQDGHLAILMPNTARRAATSVQQRVASELASVEPHSGIACYPDDSQDIAELLHMASKRCQEEPSRDHDSAPPAKTRAKSTRSPKSAASAR